VRSRKQIDILIKDLLRGGLFCDKRIDLKVFREEFNMAFTHDIRVAFLCACAKTMGYYLCQ